MSGPTIASVLIHELELPDALLNNRLWSLISFFFQLTQNLIKCVNVCVGLHGVCLIPREYNNFLCVYNLK